MNIAFWRGDEDGMQEDRAPQTHEGESPFPQGRDFSYILGLGERRLPVFKNMIIA